MTDTLEQNPDQDTATPAIPIRPEDLMMMGKRVLIDLDDAVNVTETGLYIPATQARDDPMNPSVEMRTATVLAVGPGGRVALEDTIVSDQMPYERGDRVLVAVSDCNKMPQVVGDGNYHMIHGECILAVIDH